jgi:hypothetical protein
MLHPDRHSFPSIPGGIKKFGRKKGILHRSEGKCLQMNEYANLLLIYSLFCYVPDHSQPTRRLISICNRFNLHHSATEKMVGTGGFEPPTSTASR